MTGGGLAARYGHVDCLSLLGAFGGGQGMGMGASLLHLGSGEGVVEVVKYLIEGRVDVECRDRFVIYYYYFNFNFNLSLYLIVIVLFSIIFSLP